MQRPRQTATYAYLNLLAAIAHRDDWDEGRAQVVSVAVQALQLTEALEEAINDALSTLPERERGILSYRYGIRDGYVHTYKSLAERYQRTIERIRQLERRSLRTLGRQPTFRKVRLFAVFVGYTSYPYSIKENTTLRVRELEDKLAACEREKQAIQANDRKLGQLYLVPTALHEQTLTTLHIAPRSYNALRRRGFSTIGDLLEMTANELLVIRNFGTGSLEELRRELQVLSVNIAI